MVVKADGRRSHEPLANVIRDREDRGRELCAWPPVWNDYLIIVGRKLVRGRGEGTPFYTKKNSLCDTIKMKYSLPDTTCIFGAQKDIAVSLEV
jgi:hypothetical protein